MAAVVWLLAGVLFSTGACVSGMVRPSKVLAFLDFGGAWDPSLAIVLGTGLAVHAIAWRFARPPRTPPFGQSYPGPPSAPVDLRLVAGAAVFGLGWGLGGFCPGPAMISVVSLVPGTFVFVAAMVVGMVLARVLANADVSPKAKTGDA